MTVKMKRQISTGSYYDSDYPFELLKGIIESQSNLFFQNEKKKHRGNLFYDVFYYGRNVDTGLQISVPENNQRDCKELLSEHREALRRSFHKLSKHQKKDVLTNQKRWRQFTDFKRVLEHGLSVPEFQKRHPYITEQFVKNIHHHYSEVLKRYEQAKADIHKIIERNEERPMRLYKPSQILEEIEVNMPYSFHPIEDGIEMETAMENDMMAIDTSLHFFLKDADDIGYMLSLYIHAFSEVADIYKIEGNGDLYHDRKAGKKEAALAVLEWINDNRLLADDEVREEIWEGSGLDPFKYDTQTGVAGKLEKLR